MVVDPGAWRVEPLDHTADLGFKVRAASLEGVFLGGLEGLVRTIFQNPPRGGKRRRRLALEAEDLEGLLVRWLNELVYLIQTKGFVPATGRVRVEGREGRYRLEASLRGEAFQEGFGFQGEVKGVTYHGLWIRPEGQGWAAQVILDV